MKPKAQSLLRVAGRWRARPFEYGVADCCQFARDLVREATGVDYGREWTYASEEEAEGIIEQHGGLEGLVSRYLGEPVGPDDLEVGDLCLVQAPGFEMLAAKSGQGAYGPSRKGIVMVQSHRIAKGWAI